MSYTRIVYGVRCMHNLVYVSGVKMKTRTKTVESLIWGWTIDSLSNSPIGYQNSLSWNTRHEPSPQIAAQSINCMGSSGGDSGTDVTYALIRYLQVYGAEKTGHEDLDSWNTKREVALQAQPDPNNSKEEAASVRVCFQRQNGGICQLGVDSCWAVIFSLIWLRCVASARGNVIGVRAFTGVGPQPPDLHTDVARRHEAFVSVRLSAKDGVLSQEMLFEGREVYFGGGSCARRGCCS
ncbi:hypothetical protein BKA59DRAFT_525239 [Fusarium tricinctum]|uniref:Uncharacterized protein n=1 Tax=Fusarium tricinctum TaxID=61284 RepID=A0A8K0WD10_9HYPO|nr:hypothetical protein BKA59DRAFT_525239 [Fusarium tricinctum]